MQISINKEKDGTIEIKVETTPADGQVAKLKALEKFAPQVSITGFRPGKAPLSMVEPQIKTEKLAEETVSILAGMAYRQALTEHELQPISEPSVHIPELAEKKADVAILTIWPKVVEEGLKLEITTHIRPEIKLGDWKKAVDGLDKNAADLEDQIMSKLIEAAKFDLPQTLVQMEADHQLMHQLQAIQNLGVSFEDYLKSQNKKPTDFQKELSQHAEKNLRGRLILAQIARELKLGEKTTFADVLKHIQKLV